MSILIVLPRVQVENANAICGLTYGFPGITHFLGYTHALSRKVQHTHGLTFTGCGVICHHHQIQTHQATERGDHYFALTRNPLTKTAKPASFNEEGRMHMTVTLFIECRGNIQRGDSGAEELARHLDELCVRHRLAGGTIMSMDPVRVKVLPEQASERERLTQAEMYRALPGFALTDRTELLAEHYAECLKQNPQTEMIDAWLDFSTLSYQAERGEGDNADWHYVPKPANGYLVPLVVGYHGISPLYAPGEVDKSRDPQTPFRFAEVVYGIGEWYSPHRIKDIQQLFWRYSHQHDSYLCSHGTPLQEADLPAPSHSDF